MKTLLTIISLITTLNLYSESLKEQLIRHEGYRTQIYKCTAKANTVGIGFNIDANKRIFDMIVDDPKNISSEEIEMLFQYSLQIAIDDAYKILPNMDSYPEQVYKVLVDMSFNLGYNRLSKFKNFIHALKQRNYASAIVEMKDSIWYDQVGDRSKYLESLMRELI
jgi:lysozyme